MKGSPSGPPNAGRECPRRVHGRKAGRLEAVSPRPIAASNCGLQPGCHEGERGSGPLFLFHDQSKSLDGDHYDP